MSSEIAAKLSNDNWVVVRNVEQRRLFVSLQCKNYSLINVSDDLDKLMKNEFKNICLPR